MTLCESASAEQHGKQPEQWKANTPYLCTPGGQAGPPCNKGSCLSFALTFHRHPCSSFYGKQPLLGLVMGVNIKAPLSLLH